MAYNCDIDFQYYYPVTYQLYPTNQLPKTYVPQCDPQSYNQSYYNAYQNHLRNIQNREVTMEYWLRQLQYFRNLLKNFAAEIETPDDLKKLLASCNYDETKRNTCFEKRRTFYNIDKNYCQCCCNSCLEKVLLQLCNALSVPSPCNKCNCSACRSHCQKPSCAKPSCSCNYQNPAGYYYIPCQTNYQTPTPAPAYYYYYSNPCQTSSPNYCQAMPQQFNTNNNNNNCCSPNCEMCCNKCRFKHILSQINYILSSAEQLNDVPCACNMPCQKSCCSIKEIKEETITIKRENGVENEPNKPVRKSIESTTNVNKKTLQTLDSMKQEYRETGQEVIKSEIISSSTENSGGKHCQECVECKQIEKSAAPNRGRVSFNPQCESMYPKHSTVKKSRKHSESTKYSDAETIDDASNISEEYKNYDACVKKQASITLGEEYVSPSGTFEVLIQDQHNKSCKKTKKQSNTSIVFLVDYTTYTKPKCECGKLEL